MKWTLNTNNTYYNPGRIDCGISIIAQAATSTGAAPGARVAASTRASQAQSLARFVTWPACQGVRGVRRLCS